MLRELIALPSVNNAFLPANHPRAGEKRVADFLAETAARVGMDVQWQKVYPGRPNLLVRLSPMGRQRQRILLAPHLDTVNVANDEQLTPRLAGGRLHGRGACDTKGSVAAMMNAMCEVAVRGRRPATTEIVFAGLVDEEMAQGGSRALAAAGLRANLAIVGEPTRLQVVTCHKGDMWIELQTRGRAAHGARPELGRNAIHEMAGIVQFLEGDYAAMLRRRRHPLLGHATVNVGTIEGGAQTNIVPARCAITIDRRTLPGETDASVRSEVRRLLRRNGLKAAMADKKSAPCRPLETRADLPLVRDFLRSARQSRPAGVDYFCDAAVLAAGGTPSVVFGPGDIAQAHTDDEWISLRALERGKNILVDFLRSLP
jgi:acetylornithine deacetylase/succinyl-diaminopimelate desuccinylase-like protein